MTTRMDTLTQEYVREALDYDPDTGVFVWKVRPIEHFRSENAWKVFNAQNAGKVAGTINSFGYRQCCVGYKVVRAHRLAFLYVHGYMPEFLDHINGQRDDNRIENLRSATLTENSRNQFMHARNTSGFTGVTWIKKNSNWRSSIKVSTGTIHLGCFDSKIDAVAARMRANKKYGYTPRHGESR